MITLMKCKILYYLYFFSINTRIKQKQQLQILEQEKTYEYKLNIPENDNIKYLVLGDAKGIELNYQFGNVKVYDGLGRGDLFTSLNKKPQKVGAICSNVDWDKGLCYQCNYEVKSTTEPHECKSRGYSWQPASLFGYEDWSELKLAVFTNKIINTDKVGFN